MKRLAYYIIENGQQLPGGKKFLIGKSEVGDGIKNTAYIDFDSDNCEVSFSLLAEVSGGQIFVSMSIGDIENNTKTVYAILTAAIKVKATGEIFADSFDANNNYIYNFKCDNSDMSSSMKDLLGSCVSDMLDRCGKILKETKTGVTLYGLGFKNF